MNGNEIIERRRQEAKSERLFVQQVADKLWAGFTDNEKTLVRFGMFPHDKMKHGELEIAAFVTANGGETSIESKDLAVCLMNCASADGGMRA